MYYLVQCSNSARFPHWPLPCIFVRNHWVHRVEAICVDLNVLLKVTKQANCLITQW